MFLFAGDAGLHSQEAPADRNLKTIVVDLRGKSEGQRVVVVRVLNNRGVTHLKLLLALNVGGLVPVGRCEQCGGVEGVLPLGLPLRDVATCVPWSSVHRHWGGPDGTGGPRVTVCQPRRRSEEGGLEGLGRANAKGEHCR